jgi:hypothetical protein
MMRLVANPKFRRRRPLTLPKALAASLTLFSLSPIKNDRTGGVCGETLLNSLAKVPIPQKERCTSRSAKAGDEQLPAAVALERGDFAGLASAFWNTSIAKCSKTANTKTRLGRL